LAAAPRRDLEITLAPKDLGGLAVRLKSAGDRLDISVVAEKGETARMISDRSANLASQLQGAGIGLGGIDIMAAAKQVSNASDLPASSNPGASAGGSNADAGGNSQAASQGRDPSGRDRQDQGHDQSDKTGDPRLSSGDRGLYL
jgi:flagellar hook-length control protein FliK